MPEHTPSPRPARAVYGFVLHFLIKTTQAVYVFWSYMPHKILEENLGLGYLPNQYFAFYLPTLIFFSVWIFIFCLYPAVGLAKASAIEKLETIQDSTSIHESFRRSAKNGWYQNMKTLVDLNFTTHSADVTIKRNVIHQLSSKKKCDCLDANFCFKSNEETTYLTHIQLRKRIPSAQDLSIHYVCVNLYANQFYLNKKL